MSHSDDAMADGAMGCVDWSVVDTNSGNVLASGVSNLAETDFEVVEHLTSEGVVYYRKGVALSGPFSFSLDEHPGKVRDEFKGFGFKGERNDLQCFSWEWFNITGPSEATKLQEEGKLAIELGQTAKGWEVVRTDFSTDVSLRITRFDGDPCREPSTRIVIRSGSWVTWPPA